MPLGPRALGPILASRKWMIGTFGCVQIAIQGRNYSRAGAQPGDVRSVGRFKMGLYNAKVSFSTGRV